MLESYDQVLIEKARSMIPVLRARSEEIDELKRIPEDIAAMIDEAGIYRMAVPRRFGGQPVGSLRTIMSVVTELAKGDAGVAWGAYIVASCAGPVINLWPDRVRDEIFGDPENARIAGAFRPRVFKARKVDGGVHVEEGIWGFNSGVHQAHWDFLGAPLLDENGPTSEFGMMIVPCSDIEILDDWDVMGLRGSGSASVKVTDLFIPDYRIISTMRPPESPPPQDDDTWVSNLGGHTSPSMFLGMMTLGIAKATLDLFLEQTATKPIVYTTYPTANQAPTTHFRVGGAAARIDAAELLFGDAVDRFEAIIRGGPDEPEARARIRADASFAARLCWEAVDSLAWGGGGSLASNTNGLSRLWREARVVNMHGLVNLDTNTELLGRLLCGEEPMVPML